MKQVEVQIMGQGYLLGCPEGGEIRLQEAVQRVDGAMCGIRDAGRIRARDRIAVLAALNLAFELAEVPATRSELTADHPAPGNTQQHADLAALLQRLDRALGEDGQLI